MLIVRFVSVTSSLLLLLVTVAAQKPTECSEVIFGSTRGLPLPLPDVQLSAGYGEFAVRVPVNTCSEYDGQVGTRVEVCDIDTKAFIQASSAYTFYVRRNGDLKHVAVLHTTVFCYPTIGPVPPATPATPAAPEVVPGGQPSSQAGKTYR